MKNLSLVIVAVLFLFGISESQAQNRLIKSVKVPNISTKDATGKNIRLQQLLKENDKVLITFLRPVWCPICNHQTHMLKDRYKALKKKGYEIIAVYPNSQETMAQYVKDADIPFIVISDPEEILYKQYAIERDMKKVMAAIERDDIKKVFKEGMALYKGKAYKKDTEKYETLVNADFIIGQKRTLELAYYGEYIGDHYSLEKL